MVNKAPQWRASHTKLTYGLFVGDRLLGAITAWKTWDVNGGRPSGRAKTMWGAASGLLRAAGVLA